MEDFSVYQYNSDQLGQDNDKNKNNLKDKVIHHGSLSDNQLSSKKEIKSIRNYSQIKNNKDNSEANNILLQTIGPVNYLKNKMEYTVKQGDGFLKIFQGLLPLSMRKNIPGKALVDLSKQMDEEYKYITDKPLYPGNQISIVNNVFTVTDKGKILFTSDLFGSISNSQPKTVPTYPSTQDYIETLQKKNIRNAFEIIDKGTKYNGYMTVTGELLISGAILVGATASAPVTLTVLGTISTITFIASMATSITQGIYEYTSGDQSRGNESGQEAFIKGGKKIVTNSIKQFLDQKFKSLAILKPLASMGVKVIPIEPI